MPPSAPGAWSTSKIPFQLGWTQHQGRQTTAKTGSKQSTYQPCKYGNHKKNNYLSWVLPLSDLWNMVAFTADHWRWSEEFSHHESAMSRQKCFLFSILSFGKDLVWRWALALMLVMWQSSSLVCSVPKSPSLSMAKVKDYASSLLGGYRGGELSHGNKTIFFLIKYLSLLTGLPLMEVPCGKGLVAAFPFWSPPDGPKVAYTSTNFSSHL